MVEIKQDPKNPDKVIVNAMVTLYLDKVVLETLGKEIAAAVQEQAKKDLKTRAVQRELARLSTKYLASLLGIKEEEKTDGKA